MTSTLFWGIEVSVFVFLFSSDVSSASRLIKRVAVITAANIVLFATIQVRRSSISSVLALNYNLPRLFVRSPVCRDICYKDQNLRVYPTVFVLVGPIQRAANDLLPRHPFATVCTMPASNRSSQYEIPQCAYLLQFPSFITLHSTNLWSFSPSNILWICHCAMLHPPRGARRNRSNFCE